MRNMNTIEQEQESRAAAAASLVFKEKKRIPPIRQNIQFSLFFSEGGGFDGRNEMNENMRKT